MIRKMGTRDHRPYLAACMIYGDRDAVYVPEWIEFHLLVGVETFFLYDNGNLDQHRDVLRPYLDDGVVVLHQWPGAPVRQRDAFNHCLRVHGAEPRWIAFLDADEFLYCPRGKPVPEVLRDFERWPGVGVNEAMFGTSGHLTRPHGLVIESYLWLAVNRSHTWIKSIVDPSRVAYSYGGHHCAYRSGHAVDIHKRPIDGWHTKSYVQARLRINHYFTKSLEEYRAKCTTPRAETGEPRAPLDLERLRRIEARYSRDETILRYLDPLRSALRRRARGLAA